MFLKNHIQLITLSIAVECLLRLSSISHSIESVGISNTLNIESTNSNISIENFTSDESGFAVITRFVQQAYQRLRHGPAPTRDANGRYRIATGSGDKNS